MGIHRRCHTGRLSIDPLPPAKLVTGDVVKALHDNTWYEATMMEEWDAGDLELDQKTGATTKLQVHFLTGRKQANIKREEINPFAPLPAKS